MFDPASQPTWERMGYYGHLRIGEATATGLAVRIDIGDTSVVLSDSDETLGLWDADAVIIERLSGDLFRLDLGDESFLFTAADRLTFGYEALDRLAAARAKLDRGIRGRLRKRRSSGQTQNSRLHLSFAAEVADPPTTHSAAAVFARGYGTSGQPQVQSEPTEPVESEQESAAVDPVTETPLQEVAVAALESLTAVAAANGAAKSNGSSNGAGDRRPTQSQPNGNVNRAHHDPQRIRRKHEEVRSSRLEEATMSAPPPPADPWDPGEIESPRHGHVPEIPEIGSETPASTAPSSVNDTAPPPPPPRISPKPEPAGPAPAPHPSPAPEPAAQAPVETNAIGVEVEGKVAGEPEVVIDLTNEPKARVGLIGRFRKKHEHSYTEDVVSGGIIRRVCSECHHVSIGAS